VPSPWQQTGSTERRGEKNAQYGADWRVVQIHVAESVLEFEKIPYYNVPWLGFCFDSMRCEKTYFIKTLKEPSHFYSLTGQQCCLTFSHLAPCSKMNSGSKHII